VPSGTIIFEGVAAAQNIATGVLSGGGNQIFIQEVIARWFR